MPREPQQGDLDSPDAIAFFVECFYQKLLNDPRMASIFVDVAGIEIEQHFPRIRAYWEKLLLGDTRYRRHTMNIHRELNAKTPLQDSDFAQWLGYFIVTVDEHFNGPGAERAKRIASKIATNMQQRLAGG